MRHPLAGKIRFFWRLASWREWGYTGPVPAYPYAWRIFLGPLCIVRITTMEGSRWTRQRRRALERSLVKAAKRGVSQ